MFGNLFKKIQLTRYQGKYCTGFTYEKFLAPDVIREIKVLDTSRIEEGYITAQVRTFNCLYVARNLCNTPEFDTPEILHLNKTWHWAGERWGGPVQPRERIPLLTADAFKDSLLKALPSATCDSGIISADHGSWRMDVSTTEKSADRKISFVWGPLSGFGGIDPGQPHDDPFAYCDEYLYSEESAINFALCHLT